MDARDPQDLHFVAFCLQHELATPAQLQSALQQQSNSGGNLSQVLVETGVLTADQRDVILQGLDIIWDELCNRSKAQAHSFIRGSRQTKPPAAAQDQRIPGEGILAAETLDESSSMMETIIEKVTKSRTTPLPGFDPAHASSSRSLDIDSSPMSLDGATLGITGASRGTASVAFSQILRQSGSSTIEELIGSEIAGHRIEGRLGRGGQGEVFLARQLSLDRVVALKVLPLRLSENISFINRFIGEARTLASFTHPNIVQVYDVGVESGVFYFTMELVRGQTLKEHLQAHERLPIEVSVNLLKQCLRGLERAARAGVIHRDIKPGNLLIDEHGELKLVDFGLADKGNELGVLDSNHLVGTPLYVAPEQATGKEVSSKADQYALGTTFYHVLTGSPPFIGSTVQELIHLHVSQPPPDPCALRPELPPQFGAILQRMMAKKPEVRFPSFQEIFRSLEDFELREGLIEGRSTFLAEGLLNIGERSIKNFWRNAGLFAVAGLAYTAVAIWVGAELDRFGLYTWKAAAGKMGAGLLFAAFAAIMYIAGVRKRILPKFGNVRTWLQFHIILALSAYFLSTVHAGNFFNFFRAYEITPIPGQGQSYHVVPVIPFLNSFLFMLVIISGLIGRYLWRDIANQVALERIQRGEDRPQENNEFTLTVFAQRLLRYWRIFHYPLAVALVLITAVHIISILYFGG